MNYLRWDVISRGSSDDWGVQNVDSPQVRIVSMNAIQRPDSVVVLGEVVNEDSGLRSDLNSNLNLRTLD